MTFNFLRRILAIIAITYVPLVADRSASAAPGRSEPPKVILLKEGKGAQLIVYDGGCDELSYHECVIADVSCTVPGEFSATVAGLPAKEAGAWLARGAKAFLVSGQNKIALYTASLSFSDMDGDWSVSLLGAGEEQALWRAFGATVPLSLLVGDRTVTIPKSGISAGAFQDLVKICASQK